MERIIELAEYYGRESGQIAIKLVYKLNLIVGSNDNQEAKGFAEEALELLKKISPFEDQIKRLKSFIDDLTSGKVNVQPLM